MTLLMKNLVKGIVKERRDYNTWVANETLEDYSLRYAPKSFRKWSEFLVANTALGGISFLALEAIGASLLISYGFANAFWAILFSSLIIFLAGVPITYYAAKYSIDMDLLTRGAGFGYIGSTITSLVYASFTFIFFALEAAIMAQALELYFHLPLAWGYLVCSVVIIPLVFYGVTLINQLQLWTQPIWLFLMISPYVFVAYKEPGAFQYWLDFAGHSASGAGLNPLLFGSAATVSLALIAQLGEQVDYLRFLPEKTSANAWKWWLAVILAGPGWVILGIAKQLGGSFLASLAIAHGLAESEAKQPIQMYLGGFADMFDDPGVVLAVATLFVIISQVKINVTNAYGGSLAWSNFFSRLTHSHPGRVVWLVFNVTIALLLMELGVFETLEAVLGLYSNVAIAWIGALVADLVINKPLKLSPSYIEFKRAYLYNINPVGFGSMAIASIIAIIAFLGLLGPYLQAYSSFLALGIALILSPLLAWVTQGKYYIARKNELRDLVNLSPSLIQCSICEQHYEPADSAYCPVYQGHICSLCCTLEAHCHDSCKHTQETQLSFMSQEWIYTLQEHFSPQFLKRVIRFVGGFFLLAGTSGAVLGLVFFFGVWESSLFAVEDIGLIKTLFLEIYSLLLVLCAVGAWWFVLTEESQELAEDELDKQNSQLQAEIQERERTQFALQELTHQLEQRVAERTAELSTTLQQLKRTQTQLVQTEKMSSLGQLVAGIAHEINNPVNFIYGNLIHAVDYVDDLLLLLDAYEQELEHPSQKLAALKKELEIGFIREDLPDLLQSMQVGTNRIRQIVLSLRVFSRLDESDFKVVDIHDGIESALMILGNRLNQTPTNPGIQVIRNYEKLPLIECYPGQLNQVFMNILVNALDIFEEQNKCRSWEELVQSPNQITITTKIQQPHWVSIAIADNGPGIPEAIQSKIFDAFFTTKPVGNGTGLGLSISYEIIVKKHHGQLSCCSAVGEGTTFIMEIPVRQNN
ncbi:ATP-binding protein [Roseofilum sp. BLCC_M91]|uniref:histidine kinase n=1 Tax=Roseofilum halophilum BLCC-M91 TaxID=3022259 RepID=A0ABT7BHP3_9CYAN|nr:ATP-binding protein [Roseofilum halophilum]MDJ1178099.1 ATP-binding protein [Roseofilum halophilum BLCC-M91]